MRVCWPGDLIKRQILCVQSYNIIYQLIEESWVIAFWGKGEKNSQQQNKQYYNWTFTLDQPASSPCIMLHSRLHNRQPLGQVELLVPPGSFTSLINPTKPNLMALFLGRKQVTKGSGLRDEVASPKKPMFTYLGSLFKWILELPSIKILHVRFA